MFDHAALNRLYRYAFVLTADEPAAYDLLQDSLERLLSTGQGQVNAPEAYVRRTMRNRYIDQYRQQGRYAHEPLEDSTGIDIECSTLESIAIARDELERIWSRLDVVEREILYLWAVQGLTAREIAEQLEMPRGTVLSRVHRLRARIRSLSADDELQRGASRGPRS